MYYDVFNGDADGICALHQLRLAEPRHSKLVTGLKRDIELLTRIDASSADVITVLDVSFDKNRDDVERLLEEGATVHYFDHHFAGDIPESEHLYSHIDTAADTCTSLIVDAFLNGKYRMWAIVAAFGDNLHDVALKAAEGQGLSDDQMSALELLGTCINYNGYGVSLDDLFFQPAELYMAIHPFENPFEFIEESEAFNTLKNGFEGDMATARAQTPEIEEAAIAAYILPDEAWARRVSGVFGNELARENPARAHALFTKLASGDYRVSVRAPLSSNAGADELCMQFPTGGGRKAAAGINSLPAESYDDFIAAFRNKYG